MWARSGRVYGGACYSCAVCERAWQAHGLHVHEVQEVSKCAACKRRIVHFVCFDPDRCESCGEYNNSWVSAGGRCKCTAPRMPAHLRNNDADDRPTAQVRYGN